MVKYVKMEERLRISCLVAVISIVQSLRCGENCICDDGHRIAACSSTKASDFELLLQNNRGEIDALHVRDSYIRRVANKIFFQHESIRELTVSR